MKSIVSFVCAVSLTVIFVRGNALAQDTRSHVNKGVDLYKDGKYVDSEVEFKKGMEKSPNNFQANFNLGDSYYKQGNYQDALKAYQTALSKATTGDLKSKVYHNIGNALLKDQKIKESIGAYTDALKLNPDDESTKYNLSYALDMLKNQNKQNKDKKKQNDKNQQKNKDQNKQNQQNKNQQQKNKQQNQKQNPQQNQQQQDKISKEQAQAIFSALNNDEKKLQKQLRKLVGKPIKTDKDW